MLGTYVPDAIDYSRSSRRVVRARFVPSYDYLQVTYLKGQTPHECAVSLHRGRTRYVSVPAFMSFRRSCGFAFNCERDSSQPERYQLALFKMNI